MNTLLVSPDVMVQMLKLPEFQNPLTGLNFQAPASCPPPWRLPATHQRAARKTAVGLDKRYAWSSFRAAT